ncbi:MAG: hypothetical protein ACI8X5_001078 [Planctomycetota bacterium]|jgi:hypothetical protein
MTFQSLRELQRLALFTLGATSLASLTNAQVTFSVDWHSPTVGMPDSMTLTPITEGDILMPAGFATAFGPLPTPSTTITAGAGGLGLFGYPSCVGHPGGTPCRVEVDALSYGADFTMEQNALSPSGNYLFSTDEFAMGAIGPFSPPDMSTEAPVGDSSADAWLSGPGLPPGPLPPFAAPVGHTGAIDGDGLASGSGAVYPGTGLIEPNFPGFPNAGDNLDAIDFDETGFSGVGVPPTGVYYSLDAAFFDTASGVPNSGSAMAHGFTGADILWTPGGPPALWAPAMALGLNLINMQEDDIDALAIWENGSGAFEPSQIPFDWLGGDRDMVLFSVRRGSPVVGMPDSIFGIPIAEGDILTTPMPTFMGGVSPYPGIFCAAENLGLGTARMGVFPDDLNALDTLKPSGADCNGNGVPDSVDIAGGFSSDINGNGIPDECEIIGGPSCFCVAGSGPCGNDFPSAGCRNSSGIGASLTATGSGSVTSDDLMLFASGMPGGVPAIFFGGTASVGPFPFGDGLRCAGGSITRFTSPALTTAAGDLTAGPGLAAIGGILPFTGRTFQCWFRDPTGPCGGGFNTTNAYDVFFTL